MVLRLDAEKRGKKVHQRGSDLHYVVKFVGLACLLDGKGVCTLCWGIQLLFSLKIRYGLPGTVFQ